MFRWQTRVQLELGGTSLNTTAQLVGWQSFTLPFHTLVKNTVQVTCKTRSLRHHRIDWLSGIRHHRVAVNALRSDLFDSLDIDTVAGGLIAALWLTIGLAMIGMTIATICWRIFSDLKMQQLTLQVLVHRELGNELAAISSCHGAKRAAPT